MEKIRFPDYSIYKFYKGEKTNPFKVGSINNYFWFYESAFEDFFNGSSSSDMYAFFKSNGLGNEFLELTKNLDNTEDKVTDKRSVFKLWLEYLFTEKLSKNDKAAYYRAAQHPVGGRTCRFSRNPVPELLFQSIANLTGAVAYGMAYRPVIRSARESARIRSRFRTTCGSNVFAIKKVFL